MRKRFFKFFILIFLFFLTIAINLYLLVWERIHKFHIFPGS